MSVNSEMTSLADSIRAKSGKTGKMGIASMKAAVDGISVGATVQRETGTFTTNTSGEATINCGFQPDLIVCYFSTYEGLEQGLSIPFAEQSYPELPYLTLSCDENGMYEVVASRSTTGFTVTVKDLGWDYGLSEPLATNFSIGYIAVKYT